MTVAMIICMLFAFGTATVSADGEQAPTTTNYTFTMNEGVSTKLLYGERAVDGVNNAIRFSSSIEKSAIDNNVGSFDVKVKTIITKTESLKALDGKSFTKANIDNYNEGVEESKKIKYQEVVFSEGRNLTQNSKDTSYVFNACLYNVKDENYTQSLSAISYLEINGVATQYTNSTSGSLWNTANAHRLSLDHDQDLSADDGELQDELDFVSTLCKTYEVTVNGEQTITLKHGEYLMADLIKDVVNVEGVSYYNGTVTGIDLTKPVTANASVTAEVNSLSYTAVDANGNAVSESGTAVGYMVAKGELTGAETDTIILPEKYNDGVHGELPVTIIGKFNDLTGLKKFIAQDRATKIKGEAFWKCSGLEYVAIPGVTKLSESNEFHRCTSLKKLIVGVGFTQSTSQSFNDGNSTANNSCIDIYTLGSSASVSIIAGEKDLNDNNIINNGLLTGNIYSYNPEGICGTWKYTEDGKDVVYNNKQHDFKDDKCLNCGMYDTKGINYVYVEDEGYYVTANPAYDSSVYGTTLNVLSEYNDLVNGKADVVGVKKGAFDGRSNTSYAGVTHVILPESVTIIETEAFWNTPTLKYVSMLGVTKLEGLNQFLNATALEQIVINKSLTYANQAFVVTSSYSSGYTAKVDIFAMEQGGSITQLSSDNMRTGRTYTFDKKLTCGMTWKYDTDGITIIKAKENHSIVDGKCSNCGVYNSKGINFVYVEGKGYYVTANNLYDASIHGLVLNVPSKYNDGTNGEHDVVGVKSAAFKIADDGTGSYVGVTHIILPESVTIIETEAFWRAKNAEYIAIPGVTSFPSGSSNQFLTCNSLKTIVVGDNFKNNVSQAFVSGNTGNVDIYTVGSSADIDIYGTANPNGDKLLSGNIYAYSETQPEESLLATTWRYDENGYAILWSEYLA